MSSPGGSERLMWVDVAKAMAIVLVVVHHSVIFADAAAWLPSSVVEANEQLAILRMPLFFVASGLFAASALSRAWGQVWRRRVAMFAYLYVLWTVARFGFFAVVPDVRGDTDGATLADLAVSLFLPDTGMWFLYALAVFSVLAKLARPVPWGAQVAVAALLSTAVAARWIQVDNLAWRNMALYFTFFLVGMHLSRLLQRLAPLATWRGVLALGLATGAALVVVLELGLQRVPGVFLVLASLSVALGIALSAVLAEAPWGERFAWVGSRSLPIYLVHVMVVAGAVAAVDATDLMSPPWGAVSVPVLAAAGIVLSLLAHRWLRGPVPALFALPAQSLRAAAVEPSMPARPIPSER